MGICARIQYSTIQILRLVLCNEITHHTRIHTHTHIQYRRMTDDNGDQSGFREEVIGSVKIGFFDCGLGCFYGM